MNLILAFALGVMAGLAIAALWRTFGNKRQIEPELSTKKRANQEKILRYLDEHKSITNNQAEAVLGMGDSSAYQYLEELERAGAIEQIGATGRNVHYRLK